jgi:hypothetical protein
MLEILHIIDVVVLTILLVYCIMKIIKRKIKTVYFVICEFYIFFILPLVLELINGKFNYRFYGFAISSQDYKSNLITYIFLLVIPFIMLFVGMNTKIKEHAITMDLDLMKNIKFSLPMRALLFILMASPFLITVVSGNYGLLQDYGWIVKNGTNEITEYIFSLTFISIISTGMYVFSKPKLSWAEKIAILFFVFIAIFINGKRNIVALTFVMFILIGYGKRILSGKKLVLISLIGTLMLVIYSLVYQNTVRDGRLVTSIYENFVVDLGRHDRIRMAIFSLLNPSIMSILEHSGQSILFYLSFFIPRELWPDKPYPYHVYFTYALLYPNSMPEIASPNYVHFGMTTSWLDETIVNFGWAGLLIGPVSIALFCRLADSQPPIIKWFSIYTILNILRTEISPLMFFFWVAMSIYTSIHVKRMKMKLLKNSKISI